MEFKISTFSGGLKIVGYGGKYYTKVTYASMATALQESFGAIISRVRKVRKK